MSRALPTILFALLLATFSIISVASADDVPANYPLQGYLTDDAGQPIDGTVDLRLRLYDDSENVVFQELIEVTVSHGQFTVIMGSEESLDPQLFAQYSSLELGIKVGTDDEMSPRMPLGTAPYAARAATAAQADTAALAGHADTADFADEAGHADSADFADVAADVDDAIDVYRVTSRYCEEPQGTLMFSDKCHALQFDMDQSTIACQVGQVVRRNCQGSFTCVNDSTYCASPPCFAIPDPNEPRLDVPRCDNTFVGKLVP